MYSIKIKNCRVCISPVFVLIETMIIFIILHAMPYIASLSLHFIDYMLISWLVLLFILGSLLAHESGHLLAAEWIGLPVQGITISLFGAVTSIQEEPSSPKEACFLYLAGPLMNILMGSVFYAVYLSAEGNDIIAAVCFCMAIFNGIFSAYNLLPVMPLDGGFIMRAALLRISGDWAWSTRIACNIGTSIALLFLLTGIINMILHNLVICIFCLVLWLSVPHNAKLSYQQIYTARLLQSMKRII